MKSPPAHHVLGLLKPPWECLTKVLSSLLTWSFLPWLSFRLTTNSAAVLPSPQPLPQRPDEGAWADSSHSFEKLLA